MNEVILDPSNKPNEQPAWRVWFNDELLSPCFNSKGAAMAHMLRLERKERARLAAEDYADSVTNPERMGDNLGESPDY